MSARSVDMPNVVRNDLKLVGWYSSCSFLVPLTGYFGFDFPRGHLGAGGYIHPSGVAWGV